MFTFKRDKRTGICASRLLSCSIRRDGDGDDEDDIEEEVQDVWWKLVIR